MYGDNCIILLLTSVDVVFYINKFPNIEPTYIPRINPTWLLHIIFFVVLDILFLLFCLVSFYQYLCYIHL